MDTLSAIDRVLTRAIEWLMVVLFGVFLVIVVTKVLMRPFDMAIYGVDEQVKIAFLCTSALGGAVAITKREHIAITYFVDLMPYKIKRAFYLVGLVLVGVMNAALVWLSIDWIAGPGKNIWQPFGMPQAYVFVIVPISCAIAVFYCFVRIVMTVSGRDSIDALWMPED